MGYYTPKRSHLKIAVLPQCEAFSADFAGRRSICALRRAKITEGDVKLCTAKLCLENQNKTYRDQSYPKAFPQINKRESNFPYSLAQITPDNKQRFNTHSVSLARA